MATALPQSTGLLQLLQGVLGTDTSQETDTNQNLNTAKTGTSNTTTTADTSGLQAVLNKQMAGITPDQIKAIYQEGSKAVPGLVNTYADAMGNRSTGNTALGNSVSDVNSSILAKIAELNTSLTNNAGTTAANIGNLTKAVATTDTSNVAQTGTTSSNTEGSTQIDNQALLKMLAGGAAISGITGLIGDSTAIGDTLGSLGGAVGIGNGTNALTQLGSAVGLGGATAGAGASTAATTSAVVGGQAIGTTLPALGAEVAGAGAAAGGGMAAADIAAASASTGVEAGTIAAAGEAYPALAAAGPIAVALFLMTPAGQRFVESIGGFATSGVSKGVDALSGLLDKITGGGGQATNIDIAQQTGNTSGLSPAELEQLQNILMPGAGGA